MTLHDLYVHLQEQSLHEERACARHTLVLPTGTLIVAPSGITASLRPPFSKLSRHYPWRMVAPSFAALRVLAEAQECETIGMVEHVLGLNEVKRELRDADRFALEESDAWCSDVERIVRWGVGLAEVCPIPAAARDLALLPGLRPAELDSYVRSWMG